jgi:hypothetical protein
MNPSESYVTEARLASGLADLRQTLAKRAAEPAGTLVAIFGTAEVLDPASGRWHAATAGARLAKGNHIRVGEGRALVRLADGSDVWLAAGGVLDLSEWGAARRTVQLAAGRMLAFVAKGAVAFRTLSGGNEIVVTGTAFEAISRGNELDVTVFHGGVIVANALGRAQGGRGKRITAGALVAPRAVRAASGLPTWIGDVSRSGENAAVTHAFRAVQRTNHSTQLSEPVMKKKIAGAIIAVVALGLLIAWKSPGLLGLKSVGGFTVVYVDEGGKRYEMNADDPADVEATLAKLPAEKAAMMRERLAEASAKAAKEREMFGAFAGGDREMVISDAKDENDPWSQLLDRESKTALASYREMLEKGIPDEKARAAAETAFSDSIRAQRKGMSGFDDAKVQAKAKILGSGADAKLSYTISTSRFDAGEAPDYLSPEAIAAAKAEHDSIDEDADPDAPMPTP